VSYEKKRQIQEMGEAFKSHPVRMQRAMTTATKMTDAKILEYALKYEALGLSVVPLVRGHKFPPKGVTWKDRQTKRATPDEIRQWWEDHRDADVGMITGRASGIDSIDLDGPYAENILEAHAGVELPESIGYTTGNGRQVLFRYHGGGLKTKARYVSDENGNGVDLKTDGGLTVLPPSIHKSGRQYTWDKIDPTEMGLDDLEDFPPDLLRCLLTKCSDSGNGAPPRDRVDAEKWLKEGIPDGRKHHDLFRYACQKISQGVAYDEVLVLTTELARRCDPHPKDGPERAARVRVDEAFEKYGKKPTEAILEAAFDGQAGCARLFREVYKGQFVFDHSAGVWYRWAGDYWELDPVGDPVAGLDTISQQFEEAAAKCTGQVVQIGERLKSVTNQIEQGKKKAEILQLKTQLKACKTQVKHLNALGYRKQVVEFAATGEGSLGIGGESWDRHPWMLPCVNGVVDLRPGDISPGRPELFLKTVCPTPFTPEAVSEIWEKTLLQIFDNDKELIGFVQRYLGMALVGAVYDHALAIFWGPGRNGKDTLLETISHVLGEMAGPIQAEMLLDQGKNRRQSGAPNAEVMALRGRRLAWTSETDEGRRLGAGSVKKLTGGGTLTGRAPYGRREVTFEPSHSLILITNAKPRIPPDDYALWKRLHLVPFTMSFVDEPKLANEKKADKFLLKRLKKETPGILNWLIRGCLEWQLQGLDPPQIVKAATEEYRTEEDILYQFITDRCVVQPHCTVPAKSLYEEFKNWCGDNGLRPMTGTLFGRKMTVNYPKKRKNQGTVYIGIGLINETTV